MQVNESSDVISKICSAFFEHASRNAFVIEGKSYNYEQLSSKVSSIYKHIALQKDNVIGIMGENCIETYASILATLIAGKTYVILHPSYPKDRNDNIAKQAGINIVLHSKNLRNIAISVEEKVILCSNDLLEEPRDGKGPTTPNFDRTNAYILFTSGSTGEPKGVPISYSNLNAFFNAYQQLGWQLSHEDRMLQMFELTFDVSIVSLLYPLTLGACVYTVPSEGIKYINTIEIIEEYELTFAAVAPSVLQLTSAYFDEIKLPKLKYLVVTAEASSKDLLTRFRNCAPNAQFVNLYGPTEATIYCTAYHLPLGNEKHHNGMVAIGKPFPDVKIMLVNEELEEIQTPNTQGELWVSGPQVMASYWKSSEKSAECLITIPSGETYYRTGDLCQIDLDGDILYCGRKDSQVKVNGFRIELSEIEYVTKNYFEGNRNVVVIAKYPEDKGCQLHLVIEGNSIDEALLRGHLASKLPHYMMPQTIHTLVNFPLNASNKIDRKQIQQLI